MKPFHLDYAEVSADGKCDCGAVVTCTAEDGYAGIIFETVQCVCGRFYQLQIQMEEVQ